MSDERLKPFVSAIHEVDRASLGFTPIPEDARVLIGVGSDGDVRLSISDDLYTYRSIFFDKVGDTYKWNAEHEIHKGPHKDEQIEVNYFTGPSDYPNANIVTITYRGQDPRLQKPNLTVEDIRLILAEWKKSRLAPTPWQ